MYPALFFAILKKATLIQFILSFGCNSLGHEIGEFFEYRKGVPTVSAFVQQRKNSVTLP